MLEELTNLEFKEVEVESWASFKPEVAQKDGQEHLRVRGSKIIYQKTDDGYKCLDCGSLVMAGRVAHPIWDGPFHMSGSGKCHYEDVPYCPKCEQEPGFRGSPISVGRKF